MTVQLVELSSIAAGTLVDTANRFVTGGSLYVYQTGTTTQISVYSNSTGSTPLTQPLFTNAKGQPPGWAVGPGKVDFVYSYSGNVVTMTVDLIPAEAVVAGNVSNPVEVSANYQALVADAIEVDTSAGGVTVTAPASPVDKAAFSVTMISPPTTGIVNVACSGGAVFGSTGSTSYPIPYIDSPVTFRFDAAAQSWDSTASWSLQGTDARYIAQTNPAAINGILVANAIGTAEVRGIVKPTVRWGRINYAGPPVNPSPRLDGSNWRDGDEATDINGALWSNVLGVWVGGGGGVTPGPSPVTTAATALAQTTATLNGTVNPNNNASTTYQFQWGTTTGYGSLAPGSPGAVANGATAIAVSANITGLTANTLYHFRVNAIVGGVTTNGPDQTFTTLVTSPAPTVTANAAIGVNQTSADITGTINPNGSNVTTYQVQFGTTGAYGTNVTVSPAPSSGNLPVSVSATITGLTANTLYHYSIQAINANGTTNSADRTFTTSAATAPLIGSLASSGVTQAGATVSATINPEGSSTVWHVIYGPSINYGSSTPDVIVGSGSSGVPVTLNLTGLTPNTVYFWAVVATNSAGPPVTSTHQNFTTPAPAIGQRLLFNRLSFTANYTQTFANELLHEQTIQLQGDAAGVALARQIKAASPSTNVLCYFSPTQTFDPAQTGFTAPLAVSYPVSGTTAVTNNWALKNIAGRRIYEHYYKPVFYLDMSLSAVWTAVISGVTTKLNADNAGAATWDGAIFDLVNVYMTGNPATDFWTGLDSASYFAPIGDGSLTQTTAALNPGANTRPYIPAPAASPFNVTWDTSSAGTSSLSGLYQDYASNYLLNIVPGVRSAGNAQIGKPYIVWGNVGRFGSPVGNTYYDGTARLKPMDDMARRLDGAAQEAFGDRGKGLAEQSGTPGASGSFKFSGNIKNMGDAARVTANGNLYVPTMNNMTVAAQTFALGMLFVVIAETPAIASWGNYQNSVGSGSDSDFWYPIYDQFQGLGAAIDPPYVDAQITSAGTVANGKIFCRKFTNGIVYCNPYSVSVTEIPLNANGVSRGASRTLAATTSIIV